MRTFDEKVKWIIEQHESTNHQFDKYLPYEFHLRMVHQVAKEFIHLVPNINDGEASLREAVLLAAFGHDLIEDTRVSYNDVKEVLGYTAAEIIYALTNEKGKNRKERANDKYYDGIRAVEGAVYDKLCDRIANVRYGKITGSRMVAMYEKENDEFITKLGYAYNDSHQYSEMFEYLRGLFLEK
jgi:(p)ppGpp synthase/HD superfamily hydrolase